MAMDKNSKLLLFKKVPKLEKEHLVEPLEQLAYLDVQINERKKAMTRDYVDVERLRLFADSEDQLCVQIAEGNIPELATHLKGLKHEYKALKQVRAELVKEIGKEAVDEFYRRQWSLGELVPAEVADRFNKEASLKALKEKDR